MYFRRVKKLDLPEQFRHSIVEEIDHDVVTSTGMDHQKNGNMYNTTNITGWELSPILTSEIYKYYNSFLKLVPDDPKIIIKRIICNKDKFNIHCDKKQLSSMTCVVRGPGPITTWYEPHEEHLHKYRNSTNNKPRNKLGLVPCIADCYDVTSIRMNSWEMVLFDHNAFHQVNQFVPNMDRILFSIGFLNITETELEDIYDKWSATVAVDH